MAVYVDRLMHHGMILYGKYCKSCHLYASNKNELINAAIKIGLKPKWIQRSRIDILHFDLTERMRKLAILNGALEIRSYLEII